MRVMATSTLSISSFIDLFLFLQLLSKSCVVEECLISISLNALRPLVHSKHLNYTLSLRGWRLTTGRERYVFNFTKCFHSQKTDIKMTAISTKTQDCWLFPVLWQVHFNFRDYFSREDAWLFVCNYNYLELSIGKCFIFSNLSLHRETKTPTHSYMKTQKNWPTFPSKNYFQFDTVSMVEDTSKTPNVTCFNRPMKLGHTSSPYSLVLKGARSSASRDLLGHVTQIRQQETGESLLQERARKGGDWAWLAVRVPTKIGCQSVSGGTWPDRGNRRVRGGDGELGSWGTKDLACHGNIKLFCFWHSTNTR